MFFAITIRCKDDKIDIQIGDEHMNYPLARECIAPGVHFSSITDRKFKHNRMSVNLVINLDRDKVTNRAVVPFILRQGTKKCPDFTKLNERLCDLYGASLDAGVDKFAEYQIITLGMSGIDNRYALHGEDMVSECAGLLAEILFEPNITDGKFDAQETALEKQYLLDTINAEINDKRSYAMTRCKDIMCADEGCSIKKYGYAEKVEQITPESAAEAYEELLRVAQVEILLEGCGDPTAAKEIFRKKFEGIQRTPISVTSYCGRNQQGEVKQEVERMDVKQGKLVMGFRVEGVTEYKKMNAERIAVALFGGTANSLLFKNVREKMSLCYYCSASSVRQKGLVTVESGVEAGNAERAEKEILAQLDAVKKGEFTDFEFEASLKSIRDSLGTYNDSQVALDTWYALKACNENVYSPDEIAEKLSGITRDDVVKAAAGVKLNTVYKLLPEEDR